MHEEHATIPGSGLAATRLPQSRVPGALFLHGWSGARREMAGPMVEAAAAGFACLDYDLRGHGATAAQRPHVTLRQSLDDAVHGWEALATMPGVDADGIAVVGSSFGGWLAALLTGMRPVRWLVLRVPALYPDHCLDMAKEALDADALAAYRQVRQDAASDRALAACAAFAGDVLLVWSGRDEILPQALAGSFQAAFSRASSLTVRRIGGADHGLTGDECRREYRALLGHWLRAGLLARRRRALSGVLDADPA